MKIPPYSIAAQAEFLDEISKRFGNVDFVTKAQIEVFAEERSLPTPTFLLNAKTFHDMYRVAGTPAIEETAEQLISSMSEDSPEIVTEEAVADMGQVLPFHNPNIAQISTDSKESLHPKVDPTYVPFGFYNDLKMIIASKMFYPVYITGLSGNGKTLMVEQVCADLKRECVRVNITKETDETDLIGSYELVDGNTVRREGPVIVAMKRGAVLLLDETDYGSERLLCLQPILEGKPYFDKKTGVLVYPAPGFTVCATANTKGKGSDDGRFIGANVLNEAFLERFAITVEQEYPSMAVERKILINNFAQNKVRDEKFADYLVAWADVVRKSYLDSAVDEIISTRRLVHIVKAYAMFNNRLKAIELCLNRFDTETKTTFLDLYTKIDPTSKEAPANTQSYVTPEEVLPIPVQDRAYPTAAQTATQAAASQRAANPISPTSPPFRARKSKSVPTATPVTPVNKPWATPQLIAKVSSKFGTMVKIVADANAGTHTVTSHGHTVVAKDSVITTFAPEGVLEMLVDINLKASEGITQPNPFL